MLTVGVWPRRLGTVVLTAVLVASCFGTAVGFGAPGGDPGPASPATQPSESGTLHPDLEDAEGEVTVVVRFPELGNDRAVRRSERGNRDEMRSHAAETQAAFDAFVEDRAGVAVERSYWVANAKLVTVDTDAVDLRELAAVEGVREVHPNFRIEATAGAAGAADPAATSDGDYRTTYGLEQINATAVWDRFDTRGAGVSVAVLDSGVDPDHPDIDISEDRWAEFDDNGDPVASSPYDSGDHGTHTSATVTGGNASGEHIGVAPEATLYHGKVLEGSSGTWASVIAGLEWAAEDAGVDVVSMSLGAETYSSRLLDPIRNANDLGVVVVASAGNDGEGTSGSPGNVYDSIAVGAVDAEGSVADFSSGERVDTDEAWGSDAPADWPDAYVVPNVAAPGVGVKSAVPGGYATKSGTSMAAPHVAGTVALVRAAGRDHLSQAEMRDLLERTSDKPDGEPAGMDVRYGAGVVDAYNAAVHGTADSAVSGRILDPDGEPLSGGRVDTEFGYGTDADPDGNYSVEVPAVEQTLTVDAYGYEPETVVVDPGAGTATRDVVLTNRTLHARSTGGPERVDPGANVTYAFEVANVTAVTVERGNGTLDAGEATLRVEGEEVAFGERRTFAEPQRSDDLTVEVETTADAVGTLELAHTFEDDVTAVTRTTPRTHVHPDPLVVPADYDPADLQGAVDVAAPGTTLVLQERAKPYDLAVDGDGGSGLAVSRPLTLRAADGDAPVLAVADHDAENASVVALDVAASGVTVSGVALDAGGADVGVRLNGTDARVEGTTVRNATVGFDVREDVRARNVDLGDGRAVHFDARDVTVSAAAAPAPAPEDAEHLGWFAAVRPNGDAPAADLAVEYDAADVTRLQNGTVGTWRYDETDGEWVPVGGFDSPEGWATASLEGFGVVAPIGEQLPPEFVVDGVESPGTVFAGEALTVNATVTNEGIQDGPRDVTLRVDGEAVANESVTVPENGTDRVSLTHVVDADRSGGTAEVVVETPDDAASASVEVLEPARFAVRDLEAPGAVELNETVAVEASVENAGDVAGERRLEFRLGPDLDDDYDVLAAETRSLDPGESANLSYAARVPADVATGTAEIGVVGDTAARAPVEVSRVSGTLDGTVVGASSLDPLADATVVARDEATGETFRTTADAAGGYRLELPVGNYTVEASAETYERDAVEGIAVADDETTTVDLAVDRSPAYYDVRRVDAPATAEEGEDVEVVATVVNRGSATAEESLELRVDGDAVATRALELGAGEEGTVAFEAGLERDGTVELTVASAETAASTRIDVEAADDRGVAAPIGGGGAPAPPGGGDEEDGADDADAGTTVDIVDADPDRPGVSVPLEGSALSAVTFHADDASGSMTVREADDDLPSPPGEALVQWEVRVPAALTDAPATVRATVDRGAVDGTAVTMYRHADGEWQPLETTVRATDEGLVVEAETPGFSRFALAAGEAPAAPSADEAATPAETATTATRTPTATDGTPSAGDGAGFGSGVAALALVAGLLAVRRTARR